MTRAYCSFTTNTSLRLSASGQLKVPSLISVEGNDVREMLAEG